MKFKLFFILFLCTFGQVFSQSQEVETVISVDSIKQNNLVKTDSVLTNNYTTDNTIYQKKLDPHFRKKYKSADYNYDIVKPKTSLWEKIIKKIVYYLSKIFGDLNPGKAAKTTSNVMKTAGFIIIGLVLLFLINFLLGKQGNFIFGKRNKKVTINAEDIPENIHEINFQERIAQYEKNGEYRHAIRYHFLSLLKQLTDKKIIDWNPEKTNKDYIKELSNSQQKQHFQNMAYIYDYVWYGEFALNEERYNQLKTQFKA